MQVALGIMSGYVCSVTLAAALRTALSEASVFYLYLHVMSVQLDA